MLEKPNKKSLSSATESSTTTCPSSVLAKARAFTHYAKLGFARPIGSD